MTKAANWRCNSYAQILAARSLRIPVLTSMDFEGQPANHLAFRLANRVLLPEAYPAAVAIRQGARPTKVIRYPGVKEAVYGFGTVADRGHNLLSDAGDSEVGEPTLGAGGGGGRPGSSPN